MNNELTIFDQILNGNLIPWYEDNKPDEKFTSLVSEVKKVDSDFPFLYEINFQRPFNQKTRYYKKLILNESIAYCNKMNRLINETNNIKLHKYWRNDTLEKKIPSMLIDIGNLIRNRQYFINYIIPKKTSFNIDADHKTETYIINFLKVALIWIYLETQELYRFIQEDNILIEEDLYTQFIFEPVPEKSSVKKAPLTITLSGNTKKPKTIAFGYRQTSNDELKNICRLLNLQIDFLNDEQTSEEDFIDVMTAKDLAKINTQIHIGCETTQFRYVVDKFKPFFTSLTLSNIEKSKLFYSKNGVLITASNLSRNKHHDPKEKTTIDNIFKQKQ